MSQHYTRGAAKAMASSSAPGELLPGFKAPELAPTEHNNASQPASLWFGSDVETTDGEGDRVGRSKASASDHDGLSDSDDDLESLFSDSDATTGNKRCAGQLSQSSQRGIAEKKAKADVEVAKRAAIAAAVSQAGIEKAKALAAIASDKAATALMARQHKDRVEAQKRRDGLEKQRLALEIEKAKQRETQAAEARKAAAAAERVNFEAARAAAKAAEQKQATEAKAAALAEKNAADLAKASLKRAPGFRGAFSVGAGNPGNYGGPPPFGGHSVFPVTPQQQGQYGFHPSHLPAHLSAQQAQNRQVLQGFMEDPNAWAGLRANVQQGHTPLTPAGVLNSASGAPQNDENRPPVGVSVPVTEWLERILGDMTPVALLTQYADSFKSNGFTHTGIVKTVLSDPSAYSTVVAFIDGMDGLMLFHKMAIQSAIKRGDL